MLNAKSIHEPSGLGEPKKSVRVGQSFLSKDTAHLYTWVERENVELSVLSKDTTHLYTWVERRQCGA